MTLSRQSLDDVPVTPVVGMGATVYGWSDSHACTVVAVLNHGKKLLLRKDKAILLNKEDAQKGSVQKWTYEPDPNGQEYTVTLRETRDGPLWKQVGSKVGQVAGTISLGERLNHHDFNFMKR